LGCFRDNSQRMVKTFLARSGQTVQSCHKLAKNRKMKYFALQWHGECFGESNYARVSALGTSNGCNTKCRSNRKQTCGGGWHNSVYRINDLPAARSSGPIYLGCYKDKGTRRLPKLLQRSNSNVGKCNAAAKKARLSYFGLQWHGECWGGSSVSQAISYGMSNGCNTKCRSNRGQTCGGGWHNSVYRTG